MMTGIQALERLMPDIPMKPGRCVKQEFEYIRHGTQTLIASFAESFRSGSPTMKTTQANVATGAIALATVGDTRTEQDFEAHVRKLIEQSPGVAKYHLVRAYLAVVGRVNFQHADLTGADLNGTLLADANLQGATMPDGSIHG